MAPLETLLCSSTSEIEPSFQRSLVSPSGDSSKARLAPKPSKSIKSLFDRQKWKSFLRKRVPTSSSSCCSSSSSNGGNLPPYPQSIPSIPNSSSEPLSALIKAYWRGLSLQDRQETFFLDDPSLVKQLYKLNLSLLCVGFMKKNLSANLLKLQHQQQSGKNATKSSTPTRKSTSNAKLETQRGAGVSSSSSALGTESEEDHFVLLESMEFMDIGSGILTVKEELLRDTSHFFSVVEQSVTDLFLCTYILQEQEFNDLFLVESDFVQNWEEYQYIIGILLEQLLLKKYYAHLEQEANEKMELLLLDEDRELERKAQKTSKKRKSKKKKKTRKQSKKREVVEKSVDVVIDEKRTSQRELLEMPLDNSLSLNDQQCAETINSYEIQKIQNSGAEPKAVDVKTCAAAHTSPLNPKAPLFYPKPKEDCQLELEHEKHRVTKTIDFEQNEEGLHWESFDAEHSSQFTSSYVVNTHMITVDDDDLNPPTDDEADVGYIDEKTCSSFINEADVIQRRLSEIYDKTSFILGWDCNRARVVDRLQHSWCCPPDFPLISSSRYDVVKYFSAQGSTPNPSRLMHHIPSLHAITPVLRPIHEDYVIASQRFDSAPLQSEDCFVGLERRGKVAQHGNHHPMTCFGAFRRTSTVDNQTISTTASASIVTQYVDS